MRGRAEEEVTPRGEVGGSWGLVSVRRSEGRDGRQVEGVEEAWKALLHGTDAGVARSVERRRLLDALAEQRYDSLIEQKSIGVGFLR